MKLIRPLLASSKGRIVLLVLVAIVGWQVWLTIAAPAKIAAGIPPDANRVDVRVVLPFVPERFHVQEMQSFGRVSGTRENSIEVRGVNRDKLTALARPFWVRQVEPLEQGG